MCITFFLVYKKWFVSSVSFDAALNLYKAFSLEYEINSLLRSFLSEFSLFNSQCLTDFPTIVNI